MQFTASVYVLEVLNPLLLMAFNGVIQSSISDVSRFPLLHVGFFFGGGGGAQHFNV